MPCSSNKSSSAKGGKKSKDPHPHSDAAVTDDNLTHPPPSDEADEAPSNADNNPATVSASGSDSDPECGADLEDGENVKGTRKRKRSTKCNGKKTDKGEAKANGGRKGDGSSKKPKKKLKTVEKADDDSSEDEDTSVAKRKVKATSVAERKAKAKAKAKVKAEKKDITAKSKTKKPSKPARKPRVDPEDGRIIASKPEWTDIPDWQGKVGSPLMGMPAEVMDRCFGMHQDLEVRDYIALAASCRYFRQYLDDKFFHHLWYEKGVIPRRDLWLPDPKQVTKWDKNGHKRKVPNRPKYPPGYQPFTRALKDVYKPTPIDMPPQINEEGEPLFYTPRGPRERWTQAQYTVYKEEKNRWVLDKIEIAKAKSAEAKGLSSRYPTEPDGRCMVQMGATSRTVLTFVPGRLDGEKAIEKDDKGLPLRSVKTEEDEGMGISPLAVRPQITEEGAAIFRMYKRNKRLKLAEKRRKGEKKWVVPETDEEEDENMKELRKLSVRTFDEKGRRVVHDHWPSTWRMKLAEEVNETRINMTEAIKEFKVSKSELISLKHWLVTNPMSIRTPQQVWIRSAVEALALRAHGGAEGHADHMKRANERSQNARQRVQEKRDKAIADGTFVHKRKRLVMTTWERIMRIEGYLCGWLLDEDLRCRCDYCWEEKDMGCTCGARSCPLMDKM